MSDELLSKLRILNGCDVDLAEDANRASNRCRDALTSISPALERAIGSRLGRPGVRARRTSDTDGATQTVTLSGEDTLGEITGLIAYLERTHTHRAALGKQIETVFLAHPLGQVLVTLCGIGPRTGARTLAEEHPRGRWWSPPWRGPARMWG